MPDLPFILPHWLYWSTLVIFPFIAMALVRRELKRPPTQKASLPLAYLMWLGGGFVGLHRFYVKNFWGIVFIPLFLPILYGNAQHSIARDVESDVRRVVGDVEYERDEARLAFEETGKTEDKDKLAEFENALAKQQQKLDSATETKEYWSMFSGIFALIIAILLAIDAMLLPGLVRKCAEGESDDPISHERDVISLTDAQLESQDHTRPSNKFTKTVDSINDWAGEYICYWTLIAIGVYYYEVLARYVFNSPTNWAHESMFLMFGMMYMLGGGFGLRVDTHVRVDILYDRLSMRTKAILDMFTSVVFYIFVLALIWSGWVFAGYSIELAEVSFTEWAIQHWVVKVTIVVGSVLLLLQGMAKTVTDFLIVTGRRGVSDGT